MKEKVALLSVLVNGFLSVMKIFIGLFFHSAAILAEGFHSLMDIFSSLISYAGIKLAAKPVDKKHPYGYYKFEVVAGLIITLILLATGIGIMRESYQSFSSHSLSGELSIWSLIIMAISAIVNEVMARVKIYFGKKEDSISLISDGIHSRVDVFASLIVLFGLILNKYWPFIDPLLAFIIGIYIVYESFVLGKDAIDALLDVSAGEEIEEKIKEVAVSKRIEISSLKTQKKGSAVTANLEIVLPHEIKLAEATKIAEDLRNSLIEKIEKLKYVAIQIKSHEVTTNSYQPFSFWGKRWGWNWQKRSTNARANSSNLAGKGEKRCLSKKTCVCPVCGFRKESSQKEPCRSITCPRCGSRLKREG